MSFTFATYNAQDLLDPVAPEGDEIPPEVMAAHEAKLTAAAGVLSRLDADIVCLQEVQSRELIERVLGRLPAGMTGYEAVVVGQVRDRRGLRLAVLSRYPTVGAVRHHGQAESPEGFRLPAVEAGASPGEVVHFRRGMIEAVFDVPGVGPIAVFCVHLKSNYPVHHGPPRTQGDQAEGLVRAAMVRMAEAIRLRRLVDERLIRDPAAPVVVAGDFNETENSLVLRVIAGDRPEEIRRGLEGGALHPCSLLVPGPQRWSNLFRGRGELLDHILVSASLRDRLQDACIFNDALYPAREVLGAGWELGPDSDHAPFRVSFRA